MRKEKYPTPANSGHSDPTKWGKTEAYNSRAQAH